MDKASLIEAMLESYDKSSLITYKHDPVNLPWASTTFRTVLAYDMIPELKQLISKGEFDAIQYWDNRYKNFRYELIPTSNSFSIPASGVAAYSPIPTDICDRLTLVYSPNKGWHLFGDYSDRIEDQTKSPKKNPRLRRIGPVL